MTAVTFVIGADVVVLSLGRKAGVVTAIGGDGRYHVRVGALAMWCRANDLQAPDTAKPKRQRARVQPLAQPMPLHAVPSPRVDLHGMTVEDAMARVLTAIDTAIVSGAERLEVMHGKGTGRLKAALHRELPRISSVRSFKVDSRNPGVTWVFF